MNVNIKYLKDENNNIVSPVTNTDAVFNSNGDNLSSLLENLNMYSTNEIQIGTWVDGKPTYRTVVKVTPTISNSEYSRYEFTHKISDIDVITKVYAFARNSYGETWPLPTNSSSSTICGIKSVDRTKVIIYSIHEGWNGWDFYITIEYTKTTD